MVPFFICVLPLGLVLILCAIRVRTAGKGLLLPIILAWIPVLNPIAAIVLVKEYRTFFTNSKIFRLFKAIVLRKKFSEMVVHPTSFSKADSTKHFKTKTAATPRAISVVN